jgi:hypothetical protein
MDKATMSTIKDVDVSKLSMTELNDLHTKINEQLDQKRIAERDEYSTPLLNKRQILIEQCKKLTLELQEYTNRTYQEIAGLVAQIKPIDTQLHKTNRSHDWCKNYRDHKCERNIYINQTPYCIYCGYFDD